MRKCRLAVRRLGRKNEALDDVWCFDLPSLTWDCQVNKLANPLIRSAATYADDGCIYLFGGYERDRRKCVQHTVPLAGVRHLERHDRGTHS